MKNKLIFLNGLFFEKNKRALNPIINSIIDNSWEDEFGVYFSGIIKENENGFTYTSMKDKYGDSIINDIKIDYQSFEFEKKYLNKKGTIKYKFRMENEIWVGEYSGDYTGEGYAICKLTPFGDEIKVFKDLTD